MALRALYIINTHTAPPQAVEEGLSELSPSSSEILFPAIAKQHFGRRHF